MKLTDTCIYCSKLRKEIKQLDVEISRLLDIKEINSIPLENKYIKIFEQIAGKEAVDKYKAGYKWEDIIADNEILRKIEQAQGNFELDSIELSIAFGIPALSKARERDSLMAEVIKIQNAHELTSPLARLC